MAIHVVADLPIANHDVGDGVEPRKVEVAYEKVPVMGLQGREKRVIMCDEQGVQSHEEDKQRRTNAPFFAPNLEDGKHTYAVVFEKETYQQEVDGHANGKHGQGRECFAYAKVNKKVECGHLQQIVHHMSHGKTSPTARSCAHTEGVTQAGPEVKGKA